jgi:hypothetical protein
MAVQSNDQASDIEAVDHHWRSAQDDRALAASIRSVAPLGRIGHLGAWATGPAVD